MSSVFHGHFNIYYFISASGPQKYVPGPLSSSKATWCYEVNMSRVCQQLTKNGLKAD